MDVHLGGVNNQITLLSDGVHQAALSKNAVQEGSIFLERMRATHLFESSNQCIVGRIEEKDLNVCMFGQSLNDLTRVRKKRAHSHIHDGREFLHVTLRLMGEINEGLQHLWGQVIHDIPTLIFERIRSGRASRTGHSRDNQHCRVIARQRCHRSPVP